MVKNVSLHLQGHPIPQELNDLLLNNTEEKRLYRVSRPILNHNIDQMSLESAFHWISHNSVNLSRIEKYIGLF